MVDKQLLDRFYRQLGDNILLLLEERCISQSQLARSMGVTRQVMHKILRGKKQMAVWELARISEILRVPADSLMPRSDLQSPPQILQMYAKLR